MSRRRRELGAARVACVSFAAPELLAAYGRELRLDGVELWADPSREAYRAFGLGRGSVARVWLDPRVWRRYAGLIAAGRRPRPPDQDPRQLGGDAVLDAAGRIAWLRRSAGPEDRPSVDELVAAVAAARGAPPI